MDSIIKSLSIGFLLRNLFAGIFFVIAYHYSALGEIPIPNDQKSDYLSSILTISLFAGVFAYHMHRSALYPFIESVLDSDGMIARRRRWPFIRNETIRNLNLYWRSGAEKGESQESAIVKNLKGWADIVHFHFVSSVCILTGVFVRWVHHYNDCEYAWHMLIVALVFSLIGFVSNWRLKRVQDELEVNILLNTQLQANNASNRREK